MYIFIVVYYCIDCIALYIVTVGITIIMYNVRCSFEIRSEDNAYYTDIKQLINKKPIRISTKTCGERNVVPRLKKKKLRLVSDFIRVEWDGNGP